MAVAIHRLARPRGLLALSSVDAAVTPTFPAKKPPALKELDELLLNVSDRYQEANTSADRAQKTAAVWLGRSRSARATADEIHDRLVKLRATRIQLLEALGMAADAPSVKEVA